VNDAGLTSSLLVAMPQLQDPNFCRTVLLMIEHERSASFGLVLNRPAELRLSDVFSSLQSEWHGDPGATAAWGGPVEPGSGWMLLGDSPSLSFDEDQTNSVLEGVRFGGSMDVFKRVAEAPPAALRFFLGYSGWGPGQLEFEIAQGAWLSAEAASEIIFEVPADEMWEHVVRGMGIEPSSLVSTTGVH
jgi:putative transcriptional regulator